MAQRAVFEALRKNEASTHFFKGASEPYDFQACGEGWWARKAPDGEVFFCNENTAIDSTCELASGVDVSSEDLGTVERRLDTYATLEAFAADVRSVFATARRLVPFEGFPVYDSAVALESLFEELLRDATKPAAPPVAAPAAPAPAPLATAPEVPPAPAVDASDAPDAPAAPAFESDAPVEAEPISVGKPQSSARAQATARERAGAAARVELFGELAALLTERKISKAATLDMALEVVTDQLPDHGAASLAPALVLASPRTIVAGAVADSLAEGTDVDAIAGEPQASAIASELQASARAGATARERARAADLSKKFAALAEALGKLTGHAPAAAKVEILRWAVAVVKAVKAGGDPTEIAPAQKPKPAPKPTPAPVDAREAMIEAAALAAPPPAPPSPVAAPAPAAEPSVDDMTRDRFKEIVCEKVRAMPWRCLDGDAAPSLAPPPAAAASVEARVRATWGDVESGDRVTLTEALEQCPGVSRWRLERLPRLPVRKPTIGSWTARDVWTYSKTDVETLAAEVAAEADDPNWRLLASGVRLTRAMALDKFPSLSKSRLDALPRVLVRQPTIGNATARDVLTYLKTDVENLVAKIAAENDDPIWRLVVNGERLTLTMALAQCPSLSKGRVAALPRLLARQPTTGNWGAREVWTYLAADVKRLAAAPSGKFGAPRPPPAPSPPEVEAPAPAVAAAAAVVAPPPDPPAAVAAVSAPPEPAGEPGAKRARAGEDGAVYLVSPQGAVLKSFPSAAAAAEDPAVAAGEARVKAACNMPYAKAVSLDKNRLRWAAALEEEARLRRRSDARRSEALSRPRVRCARCRKWRVIPSGVAVADADAWVCADSGDRWFEGEGRPASWPAAVAGITCKTRECTTRRPWCACQRWGFGFKCSEYFRDGKESFCSMASLVETLYRERGVALPEDFTTHPVRFLPFRSIPRRGRVFHGARLAPAPEVGCVHCGSGARPETIVMCDGEGCAVEAHFHCAGLAAVPAESWFCSPACRGRPRAAPHKHDWIVAHGFPEDGTEYLEIMLAADGTADICDLPRETEELLLDGWGDDAKARFRRAVAAGPALPAPPPDDGEDTAEEDDEEAEADDEAEADAEAFVGGAGLARGDRCWSRFSGGAQDWYAGVVMRVLWGGDDCRVVWDDGDVETRRKVDLCASIPASIVSRLPLTEPTERAKAVARAEEADGRPPG